MKDLLSLLLLVSVAGAMHPPPQKASRLPLQKKEIGLEAPENYALRTSRDKTTGELVDYDPKPRVQLVDKKSGKYAFKWIGYDGKEKTVIYQRPDAIEAVVSGSVSKTASGKNRFVYKVGNLLSSGQHLSGFAVQNFSTDTLPTKIGEYVGKMSNNKELKDGNWIYFSFTTVQPQIIAGKEIELKLESSSLPGLVECRIHGGIMKMFGVGEDMPQELENVLPGYEAWPSGYTVGPVDRLNSLSASKRAKYIRKRLAEFQRLGWIVADLVPLYNENLKKTNLEQVFKRATADFKEGTITSELLAMIEFNR